MARGDLKNNVGWTFTHDTLQALTKASCSFDPSNRSSMSSTTFKDVLVMTEVTDVAEGTERRPGSTAAEAASEVCEAVAETEDAIGGAAGY